MTGTPASRWVPILLTLAVLWGGDPSWNQPLGGVVILLGAALAQGLIRTRSSRLVAL